jgi:single-strand DNA-binding protein
MPNYLWIMGNLTADPEVKQVGQDGTTLVKFTVASARKFNRDETDFIDCQFFGKRAETFAKHHKKGNPVHVSGSLRQDKWEDKETGEKRSKLLADINDFEFVGAGKKDNVEEDSPKPEAPQSKPQRNKTPW